MDATKKAVPDRGPTFIVVTSLLTSIAFVLVVYRLIWKGVIRKGGSPDDVIIGVSMTIQIANTVVGALACHYGFGRHGKDVARSGGNTVLAFKFFWLFQILYKIVLCLNKLSFLAFYLRIFPTKKFRRFCFATVAIVALGTFGFVMATIFQCVPVQASWHKKLPKQCVNNAIFRWCWAGYNTLMDIWVCLMPMPLLARLQLDTIRKVGVMIVFGLGLFVCVTSIIRMRSMETSTTTRDPTWGSFDALLWSAIEASTGIICTCLPFLRHPIQRAFPRLFSSVARGSKKMPSWPSYGLSKLKSKSRAQSPSKGGTSWSSQGSREKNSQWTRIENEDEQSSSSSQEPIARNQILKKTDIEMRSDHVSST